VFETIAAIATPFGMGAVSLIRVSGSKALEVSSVAMAGKLLAPRRPVVGLVKSDSGEVIDETLVTYFKGPNSFTGEDVVEFGCHGGVLVTRRVLDRLLECGARAADAGEFSQRAFMNGKMDLTQAEGVMDVIAAQTDLALYAANRQREGQLGSLSDAIRADLIELVAHVEAYIDFPEEDIDPETGDALQKRFKGIDEQIDRLLTTAEQGRFLREGVRTVIYGEPNVGKSSLLNRILGEDRAIVSATAGTTRDTVEEMVDFGGLPVRFIDTAGVREASDEVERMGIERSQQKLASADLVLHVVDVTQPKTEERIDVAASHFLRILNKIDQPVHEDWKGANGISLSCETGEGLAVLKEAIRDRLAFSSGEVSRALVSINARHQACLKRAKTSLKRGAELVQQGEAPEFAALDLREALEAIGEITGKIDTEEILGQIFANFCIGK